MADRVPKPKYAFRLSNILLEPSPSDTHLKLIPIFRQTGNDAYCSTRHEKKGTPRVPDTMRRRRGGDRMRENKLASLSSKMDKMETISQAF